MTSKFFRLFAIASIAILSACSTVAPPREVASVPLETLNADVTPATIDSTICVAGYTARVRPPTHYTRGVKLKLLRDDGKPAADAPLYELDHVIPLALGGHPRNAANLALQRWDGPAGAKRKDRLERALQRLVCARRVGLRAAQASIYSDWQRAYREYVRE